MIDETTINHLGLHTGTLMNDAGSLTARVQRGDEEVFRLIFRQHHRFIFKFVYGMVGDRGLAEEITQETFIGAYRNRVTLRDDVKLSTWLCAIAKNLSRSSLRSRQRRYRRSESKTS